MIIIFEGHDQAGKTTIAKEVANQLRLPYFKVKRDNHNWNPADNLKYLTEGIQQVLDLKETSLVIDRWHASDYMYSKLFNRGCDYDLVWNIDKRMADLGALIVICYKDPEHYLHDDEDEEFVNESQYSEMTQYYREFATKTKCKVIFINTSDQDLRDQTRRILNATI